MDKLIGYEEDLDDEEDNIDADINNHRGKKEYCHYNSSNDGIFDITIGDHSYQLLQKPAATDLGIGAVVWDSSVIFSKYVENCRHDKFSYAKMSGKTVLELGSGCGLAGLAMMHRGCNVTFTDLPEVIKQLTIPNMSQCYRQLISSSYKAVPVIIPTYYYLDWTMFAKDPHHHIIDDKVDIAVYARLEIMSCPYDIILLTDCVFSIDITYDLLHTIDICSGPKTMVICCYETRDEATNAHFISEFGKQFMIKKVSRKHMHPEYQSELVNIIWGTKKRGLK